MSPDLLTMVDILCSNGRQNIDHIYFDDWNERLSHPLKNRKHKNIQHEDIYEHRNSDYRRPKEKYASKCLKAVKTFTQLQIPGMGILYILYSYLLEMLLWVVGALGVVVAAVDLHEAESVAGASVAIAPPELPVPSLQGRTRARLPRNNRTDDA